MAIYALDNFTDTNGTALTSHTMNVGTGWVLGRGTFDIQSNRANNSAGAGDGHCVAYTETSNADVIITATLVTGPSDRSIRVVGNYVDADNYFLGYASAASIIISEKVSGSFNTRVSGTIPSLNTSTSYPVILQCQGDDVWWTCNGTQIHYNVASRTGKTSTKHGIGGFFSTGETTDLFQVSSVTSFVPPPYYFLKHVAGVAN